MTDFAARLEALARRGRALRSGGGWAVVVGLCLLGTLPKLSWPDPAGNDAFYDYVSVPEPLFSYLQQQGAGVRQISAWLVDPVKAGMWTALILPTVFAFYWLLRKLIPKRPVRYCVMGFAVITAPIWLGIIAPRSEMRMTPGARTGIIVDRRDAPPAKADGTARPPVPAYWLRPQGLGRPLADQAQFVLAQQAYIDGNAAQIVRHLEGLSGTWRPEGQDRVLLGLMVEHAQALGMAPRGPAPQLMDGSPNSYWRLALYRTIKWLAFLLMTIGSGIFVIGERRMDKAKRYSVVTTASFQPV